MGNPTTKTGRHQQLLGYVLGNQASWFVDIGLNAGLLRAVADTGEHGTTPEDLARELGYTQRYVAVWCRDAYAGIQLHGALVGCGMIGHRMPRGYLPARCRPMPDDRIVPLARMCRRSRWTARTGRHFTREDRSPPASIRWSPAARATASGA